MVMVVSATWRQSSSSWVRVADVAGGARLSAGTPSMPPADWQDLPTLWLTNTAGRSSVSSAHTF